jgi:hypothetical protein
VRGGGEGTRVFPLPLATSPRRRELLPFRPGRASFRTESTSEVARAPAPTHALVPAALVYTGDREGRAARSSRTRPRAREGGGGAHFFFIHSTKSLVTHQWARQGDTWRGGLDAGGTSRTRAAHRALSTSSAHGCALTAKAASAATTTRLICGPSESVSHQSSSLTGSAGRVEATRCLWTRSIQRNASVGWLWLRPVPGRCRSRFCIKSLGSVRKDSCGISFSVNCGHSAAVLALSLSQGVSQGVAALLPPAGVGLLSGARMEVGPGHGCAAASLPFPFFCFASIGEASRKDLKIECGGFGEGIGKI